MTKEKAKKLSENIAMKLRGIDMIDPENYYKTRNLIYQEFENLK